LRLSAMAARVSASSPCIWSLAKDRSSNLTLKERCSLLMSVICNRNWCLRHVHDCSISVSAAAFWTRTIDCCGDLNATLMHWEVHFWSCSAYDIRILLLLLISSIAAGVTEQIPWETDNIFAGKCWSLRQNREELLQKQLKREERFIIWTDRFLKSISSAYPSHIYLCITVLSWKLCILMHLRTMMKTAKTSLRQKQSPSPDQRILGFPYSIERICCCSQECERRLGRRSARRLQQRYWIRMDFNCAHDASWKANCLRGKSVRYCRSSFLSSALCHVGERVLEISM
jgi:hypothetical protein